MQSLLKGFPVIIKPKFLHEYLLKCLISFLPGGLLKQSIRDVVAPPIVFIIQM